MLQPHERKGDKMIESEYLKDNQSVIQKLRQMPTLKLFDEKSLAGALQLSKIRKYEPGELILKENSFDKWIYFLISGKVKIEKAGKELNVLESVGDIFGEMGMIDSSAKSASAHAIGETACLAVDASYIDRLAGNDKVAFGFILYQIFAESLANRLRVTSDKLIRAKEEIAKLKNAE